jgi:glycosyltransferase involved in cell wall biosynthesis
VAVTVHDMIPWAFGGWRMFGERLRHRVARRLLPRAELIFAVSNSTKDDLVRITGAEEARVRVVYEGVGSEFKPRSDAVERVRRRWSLEGPYLLFVGALDVRKDPRGLIEAWRTVNAGGVPARLVLAGDPGRQAPTDMAGALRLGHVSTEELVDLLSAAGCLLFSSQYEGFGLPALEAMACGCPVVAYRNSSLPEVVGDAGVLVPNLDAAALGRAAAQLMKDEAEREALVEKGLRQAARFSWESAARSTIDGYRSLVDIISPL